MRTLKTKTIPAWLIVILLTASPLGFSQSTDIDAQRDTFKQAERALRYQKDGLYYELKKQLQQEDYILFPYLQYYELKRMIGQPNDPSELIHRFLQKEKNTLLAQQLREYWLNYLAKRKKWSAYSEDYQPTNNVALQCYDIYARYQTTKNAAVLNEVEPLWLFGKSRPKECDTLFDLWIKQKGMTDKLLWDRIGLAIEGNQYDLVAYLKRYVHHNEEPLINTWLQVYKDPRLVTSERLFKAEHPFLRITQVYGIKRLAHKDVDNAIKIWDKIENKYKFTDEQRQDVYKKIALELAMNYEASAKKWFEKIPVSQYDTKLYEWNLRISLRERNWNEVLNAINIMPPSMQEEVSWQYWKARALEAQGQKADAEKIYQTISQERDFHGFMASDILLIKYPLDLPQAEINQETLNNVKNNPGIQRALELRKIGRITDARREWEYSTKQMDEQQLQAAAILASENDWDDRAILTLAKAENQNNIDLRFPMPYQQTFEQEARKQGLNPAWVFAIARRESAFVPDARSPAGALGVMQVMPYTAKQISREIKEPYISRNQLLNLDKNVRLGSAYLNKMYNQMNKDIVLATASYNAGPLRVKKWLPERGDRMDADIWIETMPFYETREYVKAVLVYRIIYQYHLGKGDVRMQDTMNPIIRP